MIFPACFSGYLSPGNHPGLRRKSVWHAKNSSSQIHFTQSHLMETLEEVDTVQYKPSLSISLIPREGIPIAKFKQYKFEFKAEFDANMKRRQALEVSMTKAYAFSWSQCAIAAQKRIEA